MTSNDQSNLHKNRLPVININNELSIQQKWQNNVKCDNNTNTSISSNAINKFIDSTQTNLVQDIQKLAVSTTKVLIEENTECHTPTLILTSPPFRASSSLTVSQKTENEQKN